MMESSEERTVRAREFILEDEEGRERAALRVDGKDNTVLNFRQADGEVRMFMGLTSDGTPRVRMQYAEGKGSIELEANDAINSAGIVICGPCGRVQIVLGIAKSGLPAIAMFDESGKILFPLKEPISGEPPEHAGGGLDWDNIPWA